MPSPVETCPSAFLPWEEKPQALGGRGENNYGGSCDLVCSRFLVSGQELKIASLSPKFGGLNQVEILVGGLFPCTFGLLVSEPQASFWR